MEYDRLVQVVRTLADETRLRSLGALARREFRLEELSALLTTKVSDLQRHLARLEESGLVKLRSESDGRYYALNSEALQMLNRALSQRTNTAVPAPQGGEEWEHKVLRSFLDGERLKEVPSSLKKRQVVLRWLAGKFEHGLQYPEAAVNELIKRHHPDFAWLRRELVDGRYMQRENGIYWRVAAQ